MSPLLLRRYRADRLLRREFERLRDSVLAAAGARLRAARIELDRGDLDDAYAQAWQGLHAALLEGREIDSPASWLVVVTFRRAVDEHRARRRTTPELHPAGAGGRTSFGPSASGAGDLADELDDRIRLEQLLEGLSRLSERERQAATLCYLQGLSRAEAAAQMGISEGRLRKLMEGRGTGEPGVAGKIGALAMTIEQGGWCASQGSLMRALAYGILDRDGARYRLALTHHRRCSSCRAYVVSLRGLAAALPPLALPAARIVLGALAGASGKARAAAAQLAWRGGSGAGSRSLSGAAGASGAGGGLAFAGGPLGAKLAVGCLLAIGVGAGCIGLEATRGSAPRSRIHVARPASAIARPAPTRGSDVVRSATRIAPGTRASSARPARAGAVVVREFGPEQALAAAPGQAGSTLRPPPLVSSGGATLARSRSGLPPAATVAAVGSSPVARAAAREFAP